MTLCPHINRDTVRVPALNDTVFKDECIYCFTNWDHSSGIDVCLACFVGGCDNHSLLHYKKKNHQIYVNIKRIEVVNENDGEPAAKITKLAIGIDGGGGTIEPKYIIQHSIRCYACVGLSLDDDKRLETSLHAVLNATEGSKKEQVQSWENEILPCEHTSCLQQVEEMLQLGSKTGATCGVSDCTKHDNLWLCLSCGYLGCGRKMWDGSGGNDHAIAHSKLSGHAVVCNVGTITSEGKADVYCYTCDEGRIDPLLAEHLRRLGINIATCIKTEKSVSERELDYNLSYDFSMLNEDGEVLPVVFGPQKTGLINLGSTCYMNAVMQCLAACPMIQERYMTISEHHFETCPESSIQCFLCQMCKLIQGMVSGKFSVLKNNSNSGSNTKLEQIGIAPRTFKNFMGRGHSEFSTGAQQDASEYLQHVLSQIQKSEHRYGNTNPTKIFEFTLHQRLQCLECERVRYTTLKAMEFTLPIPVMDSASNVVSCISAACESVKVEFDCPFCQKRTTADKKTNFQTFPQALILVMHRFVYSDWTPKKLEKEVSVEPYLLLDSFQSNGLQSNEIELNDNNNNNSNSNNTTTNNRFIPDAMIVSALEGMGFSSARATRAVHAVINQSLEAATEWIFSTMDDPSMDLPISFESQGNSSTSITYDKNTLQQLTDMGFPEKRVIVALNETSGNVERAVEWLFNHLDDSNDDNNDTSNAVSMDYSESSSCSGKYRLTAFINHKGSSVHSGHYVAHVLQGDQWIFYNDNKVVDSLCSGDHPPKFVREAYILFYSRV